MGLLNSIFGKKQDPKQEQKTERKKASPERVAEEFTMVSASDIVPEFKSMVQDLVMLYFADRYKVEEKNYPDYLRSQYGVGFAGEKLKSLAMEGFIRPSTAMESLSHLKASELKQIASQYGIKVSGKKEELCARISKNVSEEELGSQVAVRYWVITEKGEELLKNNKYISLYLDKHEYSLSSIGLDIYTFAKLYEKKLNGTVRDRLWGEFNRREIIYYKKALQTGNFYEYCELHHIMALFLKEERRYKESLRQYMTYMHY